MGVGGQLVVVDGGEVKAVGGRVAVEWRWWSSGGGGGGGEGGGGSGDGNGGGLGAVAVARALELQWCGGKLAVARRSSGGGG